MNNKIELYKLLYINFNYGDDIVFIVENNDVHTYGQLIVFFNTIGLTTMNELKINTKFTKQVKDILIKESSNKISFYLYGKFFGAGMTLVTDEVQERTFLIGTMKKY